MRSNFQHVPMGEVAPFKTGKLDSNAAVENGAYPFFTCSRDTFRTNTYSFDDEVVLLAGNNANGIYPLKYFKGKFDAYQRTYVIRPIDEARLDTRFLYFALRPQLDHLRSVSTGSATKFLTMGLLSNLELPLPDLPTQRKIAGILSAYDDLIENNLRRIKILEEMAQSLYREWFVHFRFPGHESARFTDSPLGQVPEGWEVKPLFNVATVKYGKMLPKKDLAEDAPFPVYGAAKVIGRHTSFTREDRTIICGCRGSVGEMQITEPRCYVTNNSFTFDPVSANVYFWLFYTLSERGLRDVTGGAAQPQITLDGISQVFLLVPPDSILGVFERRSRALAELAWNLKSKNQNLRRTRDLLLPKLLTNNE